jgi:hypothetical protein
MGVLILQVANELFKLGFSPLRGEVGKLWLEGTNRICSSICDFTAKLKETLRPSLKDRGQAFRIWVKTDAQHAALGGPRRLELLGKGI